MARKQKRRGNEPVNEARFSDPRDPNGWGPADDMPTGARRVGKKDGIEALCRRSKDKEPGPLTGEQEAAAKAIIAEYAERGASFLTVRAMDYGRVGHGKQAHMTPTEAKIFRNQIYTLWADEMSALYKLTGKRVMEAILDAGWDGQTLEEIDRNMKRRKGTAEEWIRYGLERYVEIARSNRRVARVA